MVAILRHARPFGIATCLFCVTAAFADTRTINGLTFVAEGDASTYTFNDSNRTFTLTGAGPYVLTGTNTTALGAVRIESSCASGATLVVSNLVMSLGNSATPLRVAGGTRLDLVVAGTNEIVSANAGIAVPSGASLVISRASGYDNGSAVLEARGGDYCAGIGGNKQSANGAITVNGATVIARGGDSGPGIGSGGYSDSTPYPTYSGGDITINGGRVFAYGNNRGAGIGGGRNVYYSGAVTIAGGVVKAQGSYVGVGSGTPARRAAALTVRVTGGNFRPSYTWGDTGNSCDYADATVIDADGRSCSICPKTGFEPWQRVFARNVPNWFGTRDLAADDEGVVWLWTASSGTAVAAEPVGVLADGADVWEGEGPGWTWSCSSGLLTLDGTKAVVLSGSCATNAVLVRVSGGGDTAVTVSNLVLVARSQNGDSAIGVEPGTTARLFVAGSNRLESAYYACGVGVGAGATAIIDKAPGFADEDVELVAIGHEGSGIGSRPGSKTPTGTIEIRGGTIRARTNTGGSGISNHGGGTVRIAGGIVYASAPQYGSSSAGIGAPYGCDAGTTIISGGTVVAVGGSYGAGIGGAEQRNAGSVLITSGRVTATGGSQSAGIGSAVQGTGGHVAIAGGTVVAGCGSDAPAQNGTWSSDIGPGGRSAVCDVVIIGGSVHGRHGMVTNATDATGAPVACHPIGGLSPGAAYSLEGAPAGYGMKDIFADEEGKIYIWCPSGYAPTALEGAAPGSGDPGGTGGTSWTLTTPVPVPHAWLDAYPFGLTVHGGDYESFGNATAANGRKVWECYVADLNPLDATSDLVAGISFENGLPKVTVQKGRSAARVYRIKGWTSPNTAGSGTDVTDVADLTATPYRFFRLSVELPRSE